MVPPVSDAARSSRKRSKRVALKHGKTAKSVANSLAAASEQRPLTTLEAEVLDKALDFSEDEECRDKIAEVTTNAVRAFERMSPAGLKAAKVNEGQGTIMKRPEGSYKKRVLSMGVDGGRPPLPKKKRQKATVTKPSPIPLQDDLFRLANAGKVIASCLWKCQDHPLYSDLLRDNHITYHKKYDYGNIGKGCVKLLESHPDCNVFLFKLNESHMVKGLSSDDATDVDVEFICALVAQQGIAIPTLVHANLKYDSEVDSEDALIGADQVLNQVKTFDSLGLRFVQVGSVKSSRARPLSHEDERLLQDYDKLVGGRVHVLMYEGVPSRQGKIDQAKEWQQFTLLDSRPSKFPLKNNDNSMEIPGMEIGIDKVSIQVGSQEFTFDAYQTKKAANEDNDGDVDDVDLLELDGDVDDNDPDALNYDNVTEFATVVATRVGGDVSAKDIEQMVLAQFSKEQEKVHRFLLDCRPSGEALETIVPAKFYPQNSAEVLQAAFVECSKTEEVQQAFDANGISIDEAKLKQHVFEGQTELAVFGREIKRTKTCGWMNIEEIFSGCADDSVFDGKRMSFEGDPLPQAVASEQEVDGSDSE